MKCKEAMEHAKRESRRLGHPTVVWRCGDEYVVAKEGTKANILAEFFDDLKEPFRPIVCYDPDGTEHS